MKPINILSHKDETEEEFKKIKDILKDKCGFKVTKVDSVDNALDLIKENRFDCIISSQNGSGNDSLNLLKKIRTEFGREIPFVIVADEKDAETIIKALNLGADRYILIDDGVESKIDEIMDWISEEKKESGSLKDYDEIVETKEDNFRHFLNSITDWVWEMDVEGIHTYSNPAVEDILGYEKDEIIGSCAWDFWPQEDKEKIDKEEFKEDLKKGEGWENFPGKFQHKDGSVKFLESTAVPIYDDGGELLGYRGIDRDITKRRRTYKREKFLHSLLRHDVKNKIQVTKGYLQLVEDSDISGEAEKFLQKAEESLEEEENLIDKIGDLREVDEKDEIEEVNLKKYVTRSIDNKISKLEESDVEIIKDGLDVTVQGGELLEELFTNLMENSLKHSDCDIIRITGEDNSDGFKVIFEDDGKGISKEDKEMILDKGYKGKSSGGSGLGTHLIKRILDTYGGDIDVKDSEMGGARFDISLNKV